MRKQAAVTKTIYKICTRDLWLGAKKAGVFSGAPIDLEDGFIHFSTALQLAETARKHFAGIPNLVLLAVDEDMLGSALKYEVSRGGELFPHLYSPLGLDAVTSVEPLHLGPDGVPLIPELKA